MQKYKWEVLKTVEWRNKTYEKGEFIYDTDNSYMYAMTKQGKIKKVE